MKFDPKRREEIRLEAHAEAGRLLGFEEKGLEADCMGKKYD